ncbi:MAG: cache domain-containing protein [Pseudomonadota bacterium]
MKRGLMTLIFSTALLFVFASLGNAEPLTAQLCKDKAKAAAALLQAEGDAAIPKIKDPNGPFRFADGEGYIWIHNLDGVMVMHPIKPSLDGQSLNDMRDVNGVYLFVAMNELVEAKGEGWVPYAWPKPGKTESSPKVSYVVLVKKGDKDYVAGAGMYDLTAADIKAKFPGDAIYGQ